jgi:hypothetical protein
MQNPMENLDPNKPINKTIAKIKKIAEKGLPTDELVIQLRRKTSLSSEQRIQIAKATNKMENDPFPGLDDLQRADIGEQLYELLETILQQRLLEFLQKFEHLASDVKWCLYQEIELAGGDLISVVKSLDIETIQRQRRPIAQALAQLAELTVTKGARSPYLTFEELDEMEQDFKDFH